MCLFLDLVGYSGISNVKRYDIQIRDQKSYFIFKNGIRSYNKNGRVKKNVIDILFRDFVYIYMYIITFFIGEETIWRTQRKKRGRKKPCGLFKGISKLLGFGRKIEMISSLEGSREKIGSTFASGVVK